MADGTSDTRTARVSGEEALAMHAAYPPGKLATRLTKPLTTARDLSLAYSPGVAEPCLHIARDPSLVYDYTSKGNMVAVISNGTAVLGLGNLGALGAKPVMEGKVALFKRFADVDGIDLCIDTEDVDQFINAVRYLGPSFGGINLEDIKAPECFVIEQRLRELMDIPIFHDDQHGTAIVAAAGLINACHLTGRDLKTTKLVVNGAGAAAIACVELLKAMGMHPMNITLADTKGVVYQGRTEGMNQWKSAHAVKTEARTLMDAIEGADVFFGLSVKGALTQDMVRRMADKPIIFAMANPDPEITPEEARAAMDSGVARKPLADLRRYTRELTGRLDPTANALDSISESVRANPRRVVFAEGEEEKIVRAAVAFRNAGYGTPILIGREDRVRATMAALGFGDVENIEIHNARLSGRNTKYAEFLYSRLQRQGYLIRDCQRMVNQDRNVFAACMVATGDADAMVTGLTRSTAVCLTDIGHAIDTAPNEIAFGLTLMLGDRGHTIFIADTLMHFRPNPTQLAEICIGAATAARRLGHEPRIALLSYSTFGNQHTELSDTMREAVKILDARNVDFEYDGEMSPDVALDDDYRALYPFCRLTGPANILVMPGLHSAHITSRLAPRLGGGGTIGPLLIGLSHAVQLIAMDSSVSQIVDIATIAAHQAVKT